MGWDKATQEKYPEGWAKTRSKFTSKGKHWELSKRARENQKKAFNSGRFTKGNSGEKNLNWKGDRAGYIAKHMWIAGQLGKPKKCEHCGTTKAKKFEWCNKDHKYSRVPSDWIRLCTPCHRRFDYENNL